MKTQPIGIMWSWFFYIFCRSVTFTNQLFVLRIVYIHYSGFTFLWLWSEICILAMIWFNYYYFFLSQTICRCYIIISTESRSANVEIIKFSLVQLFKLLFWTICMLHELVQDNAETTWVNKLNKMRPLEWQHWNSILRFKNYFV